VLDIVSVIEAVLDDPRQILSAQLFKAKGEAVAAMKAEGMEYDERMAALDEITWPKPLAELLEPMFGVYRERNPWVAEHPLSPKSVARDLWERAMDFGDYIRFYNLARSEGTVLRYLSDVYKTLVRTIPEDAKTDELIDLTEWLGELVRQVDSSLLDEWEALRNPSAEPRHGRGRVHRPAPAGAHGQPPGVHRAGAQRPVPTGGVHRHPAVAGARGARRRRRVETPSGGSTPWRRTSRSTAPSASAPTPATPPCS
jgi:hypothetical protein